MSSSSWIIVGFLHSRTGPISIGRPGPRLRAQKANEVALRLEKEFNVSLVASAVFCSTVFVAPVPAVTQFASEHSGEVHAGPGTAPSSHPVPVPPTF